MGPAELTREVRRLAADLGFNAVGIADATPIDAGPLEEWLQRGYQGQMAWLERRPDRRTDPGRVLPGVRSIVSLALNYWHPYSLPYDDPGRGVISRYAAGDDYHDVIQKRLKSLLEAIQERAPGVSGRYYVDTGPVLDKVWAARAGLGWIGKHTNLLSRERGSWFFLAELLLTAELCPDRPVPDHCGSCTRCIEACPTDAIVEPYVLDSRRCISYLTIELREDIPETLRAGMGNLVFGCDICQDICPWNAGPPSGAPREFEPRPENRTPSLRELARLPREEFAARFRGSAVKRTKWRGLMRNVAVALGNSADPRCVPELVELLNSPEPQVRRHAGWALGRVGTPEAIEALKERTACEGDPETLTRLNRVLAEWGKDCPS